MGNHSFAFLFTALFFAISCSSIEDQEIEADDVKTVSISMADFIPEDVTKVSVTIDDGTRYISWDDTDEIGIFPDLGGYQLGFSLNGQGGQKVATFDGGGWALKSDAKYAAYFPFTFENKDRTVIPIDYRGQTQKGDNSTDHLGPYTFCASNPTQAENGKVSFLLNQVGTLVWFKLTLPDPATYTEISLATDADLFVTSGHYSLEENSGLVLTPTTVSKTVTLKLDNVTTTSSNQLVNAFMMVAPTDLTGHLFKVFVKTSGGIFYSADLADKKHNFDKGAFKGLTTTVALSDGYNMGIGEWGNGGSISGGAE